MTNTKKCKKCRRNRPLSEFYPVTGAQGRYTAVCRRCKTKYMKRRYAKVPDVKPRVIKTTRAWQDVHARELKAYRAAKNANKNAARHGVPGTIDTEDVLSVWELAGYRCQIDGCTDQCPMSPTDPRLSLDHKTPMRFGGCNEVSNLRAAHIRCNGRYFHVYRREHGPDREEAA